MTISYSLFENSTDTLPLCISCDWPEFVEHLSLLQRIDRPATKAAKLLSLAISPAVYAPDATRQNANVKAWGGWIAADIDDGSRLSIDAAHAALRSVNHVIYTSTKSRPDAERYRLLSQVDRHITPEEIPAAWLGLSYLLDGAIDRQCKDASRIYYAPATWTPGDENPKPDNRFLSVTDGVPLPLDTLIGLIPDDVMVPPPPGPVPLVNRVDGRFADIRDLIPQPALADYCALPSGEHHTGLFTFMCAVASNAIRNGYAITSSDLVTAARIANDASPIKTASSRWSRLHTEAGRALSFTAAHTEPKAARRVGLLNL